MPRVKPLNPTDKRKAILSYCTQFKGWDDKRLEKELGIGKDARLARQKDIGRYSLSEIQRIIHGVPLSPSQVSTLLGGVIWDRCEFKGEQ